MTTKDKLERAVTALKSIYHLLKAPMPNSVHQAYINEILEEIGEEIES